VLGVIFIPIEVGGSVRTPGTAQKNDVKLFTVGLASFSCFYVCKNEGNDNLSQTCQLMSCKRNKKNPLKVSYTRKNCALVTQIFLVWCSNDLSLPPFFWKN